MAQLLTSANAKLHNDAQHLLPGWQKNLTIFIKKAWAPRHHEINHNRRGEMFCGTLLWNRMLEDAGIGGFLSLGWNLGFAREFSGSLLSPPANAYNRASGRARETRKTIREAQIKTSLVVAYTGSTRGSPDVCPAAAPHAMLGIWGWRYRQRRHRHRF